MKSIVKSLLNKRTLVVPITLILMLSLVLAGCGGGTTPPPTTSKPPTSTIPLSAMEFPAGKYNNTLLATGGLFRISWSLTEDTIFIGIKAKTTGWVAIALSPALAKSRSDLIIGFVSGGQVNLVDSYDPGYSGNHPRDSVLGGTDDLQIISGGEADGVTTLEFKRLINTGDPNDVTFVNGSNPFLYALGTNDNTTTEHSLVGFGDLKLTIVLTHP